MEIKKIFLGVGISALSCLSISSMALADDVKSDDVQHHYSVGINVGTSMFGIDATYKVNNYLEPKIFGNYFQWTINDNESINSMLLDLANDNLPNGSMVTSLHVPNEFKFVYANAGVALDFHPFKNGFFGSVGLAYNNTNASFSLTSQGLKAAGTIPGIGTADIANGNINLNIDGLGGINLQKDLGNARVDVKWNKVVPYFGIGFRGNFAEANLEDPSFLERLAFTWEMGAYYYGTPTVKVSAHSGVIDQAKIDKLNKEISDQIDPYTKYAKLWPVLRFGISYRF